MFFALESAIRYSVALKVLIVDDDPTVLAIASALLEDRGYEVATRSRALGTTGIILREKPDVVVLDVQMPALNGDELLTLLKSRPGLENTHYILFSGQEEAQLRAMAERTGALGFIVKTGNHDDFVREFEVLVRRIGSTGSTTPPRLSGR